MVRTTARADRAVPYQYVGAVLLLRDARPVGLLHDQGTAVRAGACFAGLRRLHRDGLFHADRRGSDSRPLSGQAKSDPARRDDHGDRPFHDDVRAVVLPGSSHDCAGQRAVSSKLAQPDRRPLRKGGSARRLGLQRLLRRHKHRRIPGAADLRHPGRTLRLALGFRRGRHRHGAGPCDLYLGPALPAGKDARRDGEIHPANRRKGTPLSPRCGASTRGDRAFRGRLSRRLRAGGQYRGAMGRHRHRSQHGVRRDSDDLVSIAQSAARHADDASASGLVEAPLRKREA